MGALGKYVVAAGVTAAVILLRLAGRWPTITIHGALSRRRRVQRSAPPTFYDAMFRVDRVSDVFRAGFPFVIDKRAEKHFTDAVVTVVALVGHVNAGKSRLLSMLAGEEAPTGDAIRTPGICVKVLPVNRGLPVHVLDTEGLDTPLVQPPPEAGDQSGHQASNRGDRVSLAALHEQKMKEEFQRELTMRLSDVVVFVCNHISHRNQIDVFELMKRRGQSHMTSRPALKRVVVVHNLRNVQSVGELCQYMENTANMYGGGSYWLPFVEGGGTLGHSATPPVDAQAVLRHGEGHYHDLRHYFMYDFKAPGGKAHADAVLRQLRHELGDAQAERRNFRERLRVEVANLLPVYFSLRLPPPVSWANNVLVAPAAEVEPRPIVSQLVVSLQAGADRHCTVQELHSSGTVTTCITLNTPGAPDKTYVGSAAHELVSFGEHDVTVSYQYHNVVRNVTEDVYFVCAVRAPQHDTLRGQTQCGVTQFFIGRFVGPTTSATDTVPPSPRSPQSEVEVEKPEATCTSAA